MDLLARIEVDGVCLGGIRLSGVLRPKQVASVGAQTDHRAWAFRLGSSWFSGVSHARCKWLPATCSPYHTSMRARLSTPVRSLLPVTRNILPTDRCRLAWRRSAARKVASTRWPEGCKRHFVQRFVFRPWVATFATRRHDLPAFGPRQAAATRKQARPTRTRPRERGLHGKCGELQTSALPKQDTSPLNQTNRGN